MRTAGGVCPLRKHVWYGTDHVQRHAWCPSYHKVSQRGA
jgi:hypothetical protein